MAILFHATRNETITDFEVIKSILKKEGVELAKWEANIPLTINSNQEEILNAYSHELRPYMEKNGYIDADVINVHQGTENLSLLREKFMKEHTHADDEVRFFVDGEGQFWFNLDNGEVLRLTCSKGDFISVPKNYKHWFDLHPNYFVKAIRIFSNKEGWTPLYTNSGVDQKYNP